MFWQKIYGPQLRYGQQLRKFVITVTEKKNVPRRVMMLEYTFIAGLFSITVVVHLVQMSLLPTMERQAWHRQIPGQKW